MPTELNTEQTLDLDALRGSLTMKSGPEYWRSLEEYSGTQEFSAFVHKEFPDQVSEILDPLSRRNFIKVMGASMMLAGLSSCSRQPDEKLVPYVKAPEEAIPGKSMYFATAMPLSGYGIGLVATSFEGRPTKLEGLKEHPSSLGATDIYSQASILNLYDPDRLDTVLDGGNISTWNRFKAELANLMVRLENKDGDGIRILTGTVTSQTLGWQLDQLRALYPAIKWHQFDPAGRNNAKAGSILAFSKYTEAIYDFAKAKIVLSLDADFITEGPGRVRYSKDFARSRDYDSNGNAMSRLYVAESTPTLTGASADHRLSLRYPDIETLARLVAQALGVANVDVDEKAKENINAQWLDAVVADLKAAGGAAIVIAGEYQNPIVHALALSINEVLKNTGNTVKYVQPVEYEAIDQVASLRSLVQDMNDGKVAALLVLGGNPAYNAPADLNFASAMEKVDLRVHVVDIANETTRLSHWAVPEAHYLEAWGDVRGHDGTASLIQPLILPLRGGKSHTEILSLLLGDENLDSYGIVRNAWLAKRGTEGFEAFWKKALAMGMIENTTSPAMEAICKNELPKHTYTAQTNQLDLVFRPDSAVYDGSFNNNGWLQELPKVLTKLTWDNAVLLSPATAAALQLKHEDVVEVQNKDYKIRGAVFIHFGQPANVATLHLGYGRTVGGKIGTGQGFNAYALQTSDTPWFAAGASIVKKEGSYLLAHTGEHWHIEQSIIEQSEKAEERHLIREASLATYIKEADFAQHMGHHAPDREKTLYHPDEKPYQNGEAPNSWAMTIDLNKCTGCNVCAIACQSENNIPIVGKKEVNNGREMSWIRIDRYYRGGWENPEAVHQPVACMHCENAPCEPVCPVGATSHSTEGTNDMTYNRCVGVRYCANNCPYKVRRFNFYHYQLLEGQDAPQLKMMRNPNVTVRSRGVMEKCSYCIQRINVARIDAKREGRAIRDGEVITACQSACPSEAIIFGNIMDENSAIFKSKASKRNYALIGDIGTRPRTTYLAKLRNPNDSLPNLGGHGAAHGETAHSVEH